MDDRRFDSLVKSLAGGASRRNVLKGILGLGGAALAGGTLLESDTDAARRPTPTPTPVKCPGKQTPVGGVCTCQVPPAPGAHTCGPDCCTGLPDESYPRPATHSECCDNACCFGTCYGEELCCPTNLTGNGGDPTHRLCDTPEGPVCVEGTCCDDSDCEDPCLKCDEQLHVCVERCPGDNEVCCTEQAGPGVCVAGACCLGIPSCDEGSICCQGSDGTYCAEGSTCPTQCQSEGEFSCPSDSSGCCDVADACCSSDGCCAGACYGGDSGRDFCCDGATEVYCIGANETAECCSDAATQKCCGSVGCCGTSQCNEEANVCCDAEQFACGSGDDACCDTTTQKCCDGVCIDASGCCPSTDGDCPESCEDQCIYRCGTLDTGCDCGTCPLTPAGGPQFCTSGMYCCPGTSLGTNDNCAWCGDVCASGTSCAPNGNGGYVCVTPACAPNCDCSDEANEGLACNGGGGVCGCGNCVDPLEGCPCGCAGNPDCVRCAGNGVCETYNQLGSCNGGAGVCNGEWCV